MGNNYWAVFLSGRTRCSPYVNPTCLVVFNKSVIIVLPLVKVIIIIVYF